MSREIIMNMSNMIQKSLDESERTFYQVGRALSIISEEKLYLDYADHVKSFNDYLHEFNFSRSWAYTAIRCYRQFCNYNTTGIPSIRLIKMLPLMLNDDEINLWLRKARDLSHHEFNTEIEKERLLK